MSVSSSSKVPIPHSLKKTIQNLKEIVKNHSDEEIYAMLKECNMDPNETVQRLLIQDPFHEVKRKRDKKKENIRESVDGRLRPTPQGRGGHGSRVSYPSHNLTHDGASGKNIRSQNGVQQTAEKGVTISSSVPSQDAEIKSAVPPSSVAETPNGPTKLKKTVQKQQFTTKNHNNAAPVNKENQNNAAPVNKENQNNAALVNKENQNNAALVNKENQNNVRKETAKISTTDSQNSPTQEAVHNADPVLEPSISAQIPSNAGTIKQEVGKQPVANKMAPGDMSENLQENSQVDGNLVSDVTHAALPLSRTSSSGSRPSSNYGNRSHLLNGPQKVVGPTKEWKPKPTKVISAPVSEKLDNNGAEPKAEEAAFSSRSSDDPSTKLKNNLEALHISDTQHVIIPNHLQVSESQRTGLSFGSFDANFGLTTCSMNNCESINASTELSEPAEDAGEIIEEPISSSQIASASSQEVELSDHSSPTAEAQENIESNDSEVPSIVQTAPDYDHSKTETTDLPQYSVPTAPVYSNFGLVPQTTGNQFANAEGVEPQARDATRSPSFLVQQQFDPATSYYGPMYRPAVADMDGRFSFFFTTPAAATKYLPGQTGQTQQESGMSSSGTAPIASQAPGMIHSSVAVSQQPVPLFRQPPGMHLSHFPTNYLPYNQYVPQFYLPPPPMHTFLSNGGTFSQQAQPGNVYPGPGPTAAAPVKYVSQYKPTTNVGNQSQFVVPTGSEDLSSSRYKENNVYAAGQQSEASAWIPTPGRDGAQPTPFYNLPPSQGQPITFPGIYHHATQAAAPGTVQPMLQPTQTMSGPVEMGPPPSVVYQPPQQRAQMNWVNNY